MSYQAFILLGAPGCGKGTQGKILGSMLGFLHLSSGDLFRSLDHTTEIGKKVLGFMEKGELVPDEITVELFVQHLQTLADKGALNPERDIVVLDGIPRNTNQADMLDSKINLVGVIHIDILDDDIIFERLQKRAQQENRPDDANPDVVRNRIDVYRKETADLLSYYPPEKIFKIDGNQSVIKVHYDIVQQILRAIGEPVEA